MHDTTSPRPRDPELDRESGAAYARGWIAGCRDVLEQLDRQGAFTSARGRRLAGRMRARLDAEEARA